jgi:hypothetical protein
MFDHMIAKQSLHFAKRNKFHKEKKKFGEGLSHENGPKFHVLLHINHISLKKSLILPSEITTLPNRKKIHSFPPSCVSCQEWVSPITAEICLTNLRLNYSSWHFPLIVVNKIHKCGKWCQIFRFHSSLPQRKFSVKGDHLSHTENTLLHRVEGLRLGHLTLKIYL